MSNKERRSYTRRRAYNKRYRALWRKLLKEYIHGKGPEKIHRLQEEAKPGYATHP